MDPSLVLAVLVVVVLLGLGAWLLRARLHALRRAKEREPVPVLRVKPHLDTYDDLRLERELFEKDEQEDRERRMTR